MMDLRCWSDPSTEYIDLHPNQTPIKESVEEEKSFCFTEYLEGISALVDDPSDSLDINQTTLSGMDDIILDSESTDSEVSPEAPTLKTDVASSETPTPELAKESISYLLSDERLMEEPTSSASDGCLPLNEPQSCPPSPPPSLCFSATDSESSRCSSPELSDFEPLDVVHQEDMDLDADWHMEETISDVDSDGYDSSFELQATTKRPSAKSQPAKNTSLSLALTRKKGLGRKKCGRKPKPRKPKPVRIPCSLCSQTFTREADRDRHLSSVHKEPVESEPNFRERSQCRFCGKEFSRPDAKARHESSRSALCRQIARQKLAQK
ncbi:hypothetical protein VNI00_013624 [Paramarasmius palmivorus]|uniref:C2H2-type domain-containing protein n=1 Tax=Paramarasmius palmivorus TaxID=297713 RepID=A0AAW0BW72_9AGAR